jgi:hypothetical protein
VRLRPLCLAVNANGEVFVGTGLDVRVGRAADTNWDEIWQLNDLPGDSQDNRLALDIAIARSPAETVCVAGYNAAWTRLTTEGDQSFLLGALENEETDMVTCVLAGHDSVFIGSGNVGVWQGTLGTNGFWVNLKSIGDRTSLGGGAVLCLAEDGTNIYAGTSAGVFQCTLAGEVWSQPSVGTLPAGAAVTALALTNNAVYAGTAVHGLWRLDRNVPNAQWEAQPVQIAASFGIPDAPSSGSLQPPTLPPSGTAQAFPYRVKQGGTISCNLVPSRRVELWYLEKGLTLVADDANGSFVANDQPPGCYLLVIGRLDS